MPIRRALEGESCVQNDLISEPAADQLQSDGHAVSINAAGNGASWQAEHAWEAKKIRMIVAGVARVVTIAFDAGRNQRCGSRRGRRSDDIHPIVRRLERFTNSVPGALHG